MPIHFCCPHCEKLLAIGTAKGGTRIHCPLCNRLITVPPRTEVNLPTTTVIPPELAQAWWMDAPLGAAPQSTAPSETPAAPPPPQDWWLPTDAPSPPAEQVVTAPHPPSVPPPLPEAIVAPPPSESPPDSLVFEPPTKPPASASPSESVPRFFAPLHIALVVGAVVVSLLALLVLILWLRGSEPAPELPSQKPAGKRKSD